jgi:hypothetical protein
MKSHRVYNVSWLLTFLPILLFLCFTANPLQAEEPLSKESSSEEPQFIEAPPGGYEKITDRLMLITHFSAFYTLSDLHGSDTLSGGALNGLIAPTYKFDDKKFLILMYDGQYYKKREFYSDDIGPKERSEFQRHTITPMVRIDFGKESRYSITPSFFYTATYNKDIEPGGWSNGLYNYRDTGAGIDFDMRKLGYGGGEGALKLGAQYYKRRYPNYTSLLDLAAGIGTEEDEKDYHGVIARARYNWTQKTGFSWGAEYFLLYKDLDDKKVVRSDGVLSSTEQRDYLHSLDLKCWYVIDEVDGRLRVGLDLNSSLKDSNQNYYDGMGTLTLADDVFLPDFYDYRSYRIRPNISYTLALIPLTPSLSYSYQKTDYTDRRARFSTGAYKNDKQWETMEVIELEFRYDLTENWGLLAQWQRIIARSNNDDESVYQYDYKIANYSVGVSYKF